jgi:hypothetical protein
MWPEIIKILPSSGLEAETSSLLRYRKDFISIATKKE